MKIIALEGIDKTGKHTQSKLLAEKLKEQGYKVATGEFHNYDSPTGEIIRAYLAKEIQLTKFTVELIMAADKQAEQVRFAKYQEEGYDYLILDRYLLSQVAFGVAKGIPIHFIQMITSMIQPADLNILLHLPVEESMSRKGKHNNGENDRYEEDAELLAKAQEAFMQFVPEEERVDAMQSVEEIHKQIMKIVEEDRGLVYDESEHLVERGMGNTKE